MGVVYRARQARPPRVVALKMMRGGRLASPAERQRFRLEAEAVAALDHPNIVPVFAVGEARGQSFLCLKYLEGGLAGHRTGPVRRRRPVLAALVGRGPGAVVQRPGAGPSRMNSRSG